jgi:hypothetical protein
VVFSSYAQRGQANNTPESKALKTTNNMQIKLGLSEEQIDKVYQLNLNTIKDSRSLKVTKRNDASGLKEGYQELHKVYDQTLNAILNSDQYSQWKNNQTEARAKKQKELVERLGKKAKFNANQEDPEEEMTWEELDD